MAERTERRLSAGDRWAAVLDRHGLNRGQDDEICEKHFNHRAHDWCAVCLIEERDELRYALERLKVFADSPISNPTPEAIEYRYRFHRLSEAVHEALEVVR